MKLRFSVVLATVLCSSAAQYAAHAEDQSAFTNAQEKASYAAGVFFGNQIKSGGLNLNLDLVNTGMKDVLEGREPKMNQQQAREAIMSYQMQHNKEVAEKNIKLGEEFLAENKKKEGVQTKEVTLPDGKTAEFQYKVITEGQGEKPQPTDTVKVNYRGTLINGTEFDSSAKHGGQPVSFRVGGVIKGWSEALQLMPVGSKWQLFIPASLAYGERGTPGIEPGSTLIFEVELLEIVKPTAEPTTAQPKPLTSDIIRVPSAEEMKQGQKIEVIKASDLEKSNAVNSAASGIKTNK
jgi:FKBP-type peptidyl-prolyl cis-trans isomerase